MPYYYKQDPNPLHPPCNPWSLASSVLSSHYGIALYYYDTTLCSISPDLPAMSIRRPSASKKHRTSASHYANARHHPACLLGVLSSQAHRACHARRERALAP